MFYIEIFDSNSGKSKYICRGEWSKYDLTGNRQSAMLFDSIEEIQTEIKSADDFIKRVEFADGTSAPPSLIWSGLNINYENPVGVGVIRICEVRHILHDEISVTDRHMK